MGTLIVIISYSTLFHGHFGSAREFLHIDSFNVPNLLFQWLGQICVSPRTAYGTIFKVKTAFLLQFFSRIKAGKFPIDVGPDVVLDDNCRRGYESCLTNKQSWLLPQDNDIWPDLTERFDQMEDLIDLLKLLQLFVFHYNIETLPLWGVP